jgi:hypothetical protein
MVLQWYLLELIYDHVVSAHPRYLTVIRGKSNGTAPASMVFVDWHVLMLPLLHRGTATLLLHLDTYYKAIRL